MPTVPAPADGAPALPTSSPEPRVTALIPAPAGVWAVYCWGEEYLAQPVYALAVLAYPDHDRVVPVTATAVEHGSSVAEWRAPVWIGGALDEARAIAACLDVIDERWLDLESDEPGPGPA